MNRNRIPTVIAFLALFATLAGTATAAKLITGKQIKNNSVTGKDIKTGSLAASDLSAKAKASLKGATGPAGAAGAQGPAGAAGAQGPAGPAVAPKAFFSSLGSESLAADVEEAILTKDVPAGSYAVTAKLTLFQLAADNGGCSLTAGGKDLDNVSVIPSAGNARTPMTLTGVTTLANGGPIRIGCVVDAGSGSASQVKITAIPVSEIG